MVQHSSSSNQQQRPAARNASTTTARRRPTVRLCIMLIQIVALVTATIFVGISTTILRRYNYSTTVDSISPSLFDAFVRGDNNERGDNYDSSSSSYSSRRAHNQPSNNNDNSNDNYSREIDTLERELAQLLAEHDSITKEINHRNNNNNNHYKNDDANEKKLDLMGWVTMLADLSNNVDNDNDDNDNEEIFNNRNNNNNEDNEKEVEDNTDGVVEEKDDNDDDEEEDDVEEDEEVKDKPRTELSRKEINKRAVEDLREYKARQRMKRRHGVMEEEEEDEEEELRDHKNNNNKRRRREKRGRRKSNNDDEEVEKEEEEDEEKEEKVQDEWRDNTNNNNERRWKKWSRKKNENELEDSNNNEEEVVEDGEVEEEDDEEEEEEIESPTPKKYWIKKQIFQSLSISGITANSNGRIGSGSGDGRGAIIPIDLSVNHLQRIVRASGSPNTLNNHITEEFLPIISSSDILGFRWRNQVRALSVGGGGGGGNNVGHASKTTAYQIITRHPHYHHDKNDNIGEDYDHGDDDDDDETSTLLWDSGKVDTPDGLPDVVLCTNDCVTKLMSKDNIGIIVEWKVIVWDSSYSSTTSSSSYSSSKWSKFAIGPSQSNGHEMGSNDNDDEWMAKWISHPIDVQSWSSTDAGAFWSNVSEDRELACTNWEKRSQLPIFRTKLDMKSVSRIDDEEEDSNNNDDDEIASALLVVSGLGSFRVSFDGVPLSSSGPLDPPLTDFAQRVSYRGFDVTKFLTSTTKGKSKIDGAVHEDAFDGATGEEQQHEHVIGISMGSGWWDHRPITGGFIRLYLMPHGAVTCIAQLYVTYKKKSSSNSSSNTKTTKVLLPTGRKSSGWQVAKGHLRESSLFSGEYIDLQTMASFRGWDTPEGWSDVEDVNEDIISIVVGGGGGTIHSWVEPTLYQSDTTLEKWRTALHYKSSARKLMVRQSIIPEHTLAPIGRLIPNEIPPVMPVERVEPDELYSLGQGRWMIDFGKGISGMVRFDSGLPEPIVPDKYPRGHSMSTLSSDESYITVVYGDSIELSTGDINIALVAGMGLHDGGPNHKSKKLGHAIDKGGPCYPKDHHEPGSLLQRDVYILPRKSYDDGSSSSTSSSSKGSFADARQSHFTTHAFRFAEICCTAEPPAGVHALAYRTAFKEWGDFSSSNVQINGGYELVKNAMNSNMLGVQSDCPHREKIQYGGDILADSPASLHFYDMSSFYRKVVMDWRDQQWDNGAYAGTSTWLALNDYAGIGDGAGETVWASAPVVMTARHMQHYGDLNFLIDSYDNHLQWFNFLRKNFDNGMRVKKYDDNLVGYIKEGSGLGDWLSFRARDTWLAHQSFYMATARSIAYIASKIGKSAESKGALAVANSVKDRINRLYLQRNGQFRPPDTDERMSPGPELSLYNRVVPGEKRCNVLHRSLHREGHTWPGSEEMAFLRNISDATLNEMIESGEVTKRGTQWAMGWSQWHGFSEGILAIRYALKTLSDNGLHNIALGKANGFGVGTFEYMLAHNATTHWESWWRSEDLYSHNHPMLGASAEWMASEVAGVSLHPTTTAGKLVVFWPRFPNSASTLVYASATQGTRRGDYSIAWKFEDLPTDEDLYDSAIVKIHIRLYIPPDGNAIFRLPEYSNGEGVRSVIKYATQIPDIEQIKDMSLQDCNKRRNAKMGFNYNWEFDNEDLIFVKVPRKKAIGTPCSSYLFHPQLDKVVWSSSEIIVGSLENGIEVDLVAGLYDVMIDQWQLKSEVKGKKRDWRIASIKDFYRSIEDIGPYCSDTDTFEWSVDDASHLI